MYTVDGVNVAIIFQYEDEWDDKCRLENISNPYDKVDANKRRKYKYTNGVVEDGPFKGCCCTHVSIDDTIDEMEGVTEEEISKYEAAKALFMCSRILADFGWEALSRNLTYGKYAAEYLPCSGGDGQCSMFCSNFGFDCGGKI